MNIFKRIAKLALSEYEFKEMLATDEIKKDLKEIMRNRDAEISDGCSNEEYLIIKGKNTNNWRVYFLDENTPMVVYPLNWRNGNTILMTKKLFCLPKFFNDKKSTYYGIPLKRNTYSISTIKDYNKKYNTIIEWVKENVKDYKILN